MTTGGSADSSPAKATNFIKKYMGNYTYSNGVAKFSDHDKAVKSAISFTEWAKEKNELTDCDFDIGDIQVGEESNIIEFKVQSSKYGNCEYQCEEVLKFFKEQEGIVEIEMPLFEYCDTIYWDNNDSKKEI